MNVIYLGQGIVSQVKSSLTAPVAFFSLGAYKTAFYLGDEVNIFFDSDAKVMIILNVFLFFVINFFFLEQ